MRHIKLPSKIWCIKISNIKSGCCIKISVWYDTSNWCVGSNLIYQIKFWCDGSNQILMWRIKSKHGDVCAALEAGAGGEAGPPRPGQLKDGWVPASREVKKTDRELTGKLTSKIPSKTCRFLQLLPMTFARELTGKILPVSSRAKDLPMSSAHGQNPL